MPTLPRDRECGLGQRTMLVAEFIEPLGAFLAIKVDEKQPRLSVRRSLVCYGTMRVYTRDELDRLRLIKYLVDEAGVNLAGVQRLLSAVEIVERMRPLVGDDPGPRSETRQRLARELDALSRVLGL